MFMGAAAASPKAGNPFPCTVCRMRFRTRLEMLGHRYSSHPNVAAVAPASRPPPPPPSDPPAAGDMHQ
jgi:hypothetical protein